MEENNEMPQGENIYDSSSPGDFEPVEDPNPRTAPLNPDEAVATPGTTPEEADATQDSGGGAPDKIFNPRIVQIGEREHTTVFAMDLLEYGVNHKYVIGSSPDGEKTFATLEFQKGPVKEKGLNGIFIEDLIAICIDRLKFHQQTKFSCHQNENAVSHLECALNWLNDRTKERVERHVEGTSTP